MITKFAAISNAALRARWSTVAILTLLLTANRAVLDWTLVSVDPMAFAAKLFVTLIVSFLLALVIHIALYMIFSPKQH